MQHSNSLCKRTKHIWWKNKKIWLAVNFKSGETPEGLTVFLYWVATKNVWCTLLHMALDYSSVFKWKCDNVMDVHICNLPSIHTMWYNKRVGGFILINAGLSRIRLNLLWFFCVSPFKLVSTESRSHTRMAHGNWHNKKEWSGLKINNTIMLMNMW